MYKFELVAPSVITIIMVGGDEVQVQEGNAQDEMQTLTNEDIKEIKEEVDEQEEVDSLVLLLKKKDEPV